MKHIAFAAVSSAALGLIVQMGYSIRPSGSYQTGVGEQRVIRLEDGSRVSLNSDTRVRVSFTGRERHLLLTRGEAFFEVTHAPARPFVVTVAGHDVTALGTSFLVRHDQDRTAVTLVEGKVAVSDEALAAPELASASPNGSSLPRSAALPVRHERSELTLAPGERLIFSRNRAPQLDMPRIDEITAWRRGEVILDKMPLDEAIAEMNRYESEKLVIDSPQAGRLRVSGIYHTGDSQGFAQAMAQLYRLQVAEADGQIHLTGNPELPGASQR